MSSFHTSPPRTARILAVDDSPTQLASLSYVLEDAGFTVFCARNGREALDFVQKHAFDVVISDVLMPEMDGHALCRALREDEATRHLPVVLLTSLGEPAEVVRALESGANHFVFKPFDESALVARICEILDCEDRRHQQGNLDGELTVFGGESFVIRADRKQVIDLMLSTYADAVNRHRELVAARDALEQLNRDLDARVATRTVELTEEISDHLRTQESLELAALQWQTTFDATKEAFWLLDQDNRVLRSNRMADALRDSHGANVGGQGCWIVAHGTDRPSADCPVMRARRSLARETCEQEIDGRLYLVIADPIVDADGRYLGTVQILTDVTENRRIAAELKQQTATLADRVKELEVSEQRLADSQTLAKVGSYSMDIDTGLWTGSAALDGILGIEADYGRSLTGWAGLIHPDDRDRMMAHLEVDVLGKRQPFNTEYRIVRPADDAVGWVHVLGKLRLDERGQVVEMVGTIQEITASKRAESARLEIEKQLHMSQKLEAVGQLASGVAHDFNNLLSVILCYTQFAVDALPVGNPLRDELTEVVKAGKSAAMLTRQLLTFARKQTHAPEVLDLNEIASNLEKMLQRLIGTDIDYVQVLTPDLRLIKADPGQMEQVIMNLVLNARDAISDGGRITVETANADLDAEMVTLMAGAVPGPYVMLSVSDNGCGMDAATQRRVFEPFFTTKEIGKGTGLGLASVHGIVTQNGGHISLVSEPGRGTTFKVYLPQVDDRVARISDLLQPVLVGGHETILVVDDQPVVRTVAASILEASGYKVRMAANGEEALLICENSAERIDLVLTDVVMPVMNGRQLAERLALLRPGLPVLFMPGNVGDVLAYSGALDGEAHVVAKPFNAAHLARKVRELLDSSPS